MSDISPRCRTRIVCISDTHNQTPQLPKGDVLIHAGDLTNQGSYSELKKTVAWLEKADFETKIVVAGNHDITLDSDFYQENWAYYHNQRRQDSEECISLLRDSPSMTYLEHEPRHVRLTSSTGPQTHFTVFGSPYSPAHGLWAFGYREDEAQHLWNEVPSDTDILITHTPPRGHCDRTVTKNGRAGCEQLRRRLAQVRPRLHVCGHMHEGRGAESILWKGEEEESFQYWSDPGLGEGNKKQSILSLMPDKPSEWFSTRVARSNARATGRRRRTSNGSTTSSVTRSDTDASSADTEISRGGRTMTCVANPAIMQNSWGGPKRLNKPIVVDIELPVWSA